MFTSFAHETFSENRLHRGWSTLASFAVQGLLVSVVLLLPLFYTQALPRLHFMESMVLSPPSGPAPATPHARQANVVAINATGEHLMMPSRIPKGIATFRDNDMPSAPDLNPGFFVPGGIGPSDARNAVFGRFGNGEGYVPPAPKPAPIAPSMRVSHMMEGNLVHRVQPVYPPLAREARIQGSVVLHAVIDRAGKIENLQVISGHPLLVQAAMDAVRQWRYRPYILNEQPIEVETQITVNFLLAGGG
jgi:periplasmic protein TonB